MKKIFIDTNVFLRFLLPDIPKIHLICSHLISIIQNGEFIVYTSNVVIQELLYVMIKTYRFPKTTVLTDILKLTKLRNLVIIEKTDTLEALSLFQKYNIKFGDCLIATQIPPKTTLCTYDTDFTKIPYLQVATPDIILKNHQPRKY